MKLKYGLYGQDLNVRVTSEPVENKVKTFGVEGTKSKTVEERVK